MADTSNLSQFLTDVAGAIKEKTGKTDKIPAANFDTEILSIEAGGDVKLFKTEEKMQADTTAKEGDLAVVYRSEARTVQNGDTITSITFPKTVVFDTAITSSYNSRLRNSNEPRIYLDIRLSSTSCYFMDMYGTIPEIEYSSTDGITYTRTDSNDDTYEIGETTISDLDEHICKFIQVGGNIFEGLFEGRTVNGINIPALSSISFTVSGTSIENINFAKDNYYTLKNNDILQNLLEKIRNDIGFDEFNLDGGFLLGFDENNKLCAYIAYNTSTNLAWTYASYRYRSLLYDASTSQYKGIYYNDSSALNYAIGMYKFVLDLENQTYTKSIINKAQIGSTNRIYFPENFHSILVRYDIIDKYSNNPEIYVQVVSGGSFTNNDLGTNINSVNAEKENYGYDIFQYIKYFSAPTQLSTLPDEVWLSTFYGKNGVETGVLQETTSLDKNQLKARVSIWNKYNTGLSSNNKNLSSCFSNCTDLTTIPLIDTSETINMSQMFWNCTNLITIPQLNTNKVTNTTNMFYGCSKLETIPLIDTSIVTNMSSMFRNCISLTTIPLLDMSSTTDVSAMFSGCSKLETIPQLDISNATNMDSMFTNCTSLATVPTLNTSKITAMQNVFNGCTNLVTVAPLDASSATRLDGTFQNCSSLTTVSLSNTSKVTMIDGMFKNCTSLITAPTLDMTNVTRTVDAFNGCTNLTTMPIWNMPNVEFVYNMFAGCTSLSDESLNNILAMCTNATKVNSSFKTLKNIGLTSDQADKCKTLSNYSAFTAAGWMIGY